MEKSELTVKQISQIQLKTYANKKVAQFIKKSKVPVNAFYVAMSGGKVKVKHIESILKTLEKYA